MKAKQRFDYLLFKAIKDENGFIFDVPVVARVGLQEYTLADGSTQREFRPESEVFDIDSLTSYRGKPITLGHVTVTPDNAKDVVVGNCSGEAFADRGEGKVMCPITIMDSDAIAAAESGKARELSVGYTVIEIHREGWGSNASGEYIFKDDVGPDISIPDDWVEFDVLQTKIRVNHVALVSKGRAGVARLNLDGSEEIKYDEHVQLTNEESNMTVKIKIDSAEVEVSKDVADHIGKLQTAAEQAGAKVDGLQAERDALKVKVDGIPAQIEAAVAKAKADADELAGLVAIAGEIGIKCDGLGAKEIKVAYIKEVSGIDATEKSDSYIEAAFDLAKESDKMAAQRVKVFGTADKSDGKENESFDPQDRLKKLINKK